MWALKEREISGHRYPEFQAVCLKMQLSSYPFIFFVTHFSPGPCFLWVGRLHEYTGSVFLAASINSWWHFLCNSFISYFLKIIRIFLRAAYDFCNVMCLWIYFRREATLRMNPPNVLSPYFSTSLVLQSFVLHSASNWYN